MKKRLIVVFGLMAVVLLSGCGDKVVDNQEDEKSLDNLQGNLSFTIDELNVIEKELFPVSYAYTTYLNEDGSISDSGYYIYLPDDEHLLPIEKYVVDKKISNSEVKKGLVYSMVDATLDGGDILSILYINDPETLKYSFATVYGKNETTSYTFSY